MYALIKYGEPALELRWVIKCLYVTTVKNDAGVKVNKKGGCSLSLGKHDGDWKRLWEAGMKAAGWPFLGRNGILLCCKLR